VKSEEVCEEWCVWIIASPLSQINCEQKRSDIYLVK
jgi:hypothetical protein